MPVLEILPYNKRAFHEPGTETLTSFEYAFNHGNATWGEVIWKVAAEDDFSRHDLQKSGIEDAYPGIVGQYQPPESAEFHFKRNGDDTLSIVFSGEIAHVLDDLKLHVVSEYVLASEIKHAAGGVKVQFITMFVPMQNDFDMQSVANFMLPDGATITTRWGCRGKHR